MPFPDDVLSYPQIPSGTLTQTPVSGETHRTIHNDFHENVPLIAHEVGYTPAAADDLGYVRIGDDDGHGLWVPISALVGPSLIVNGNFDHFAGVGGSGTQTSTTTYNTATSYAADQFYVLPAGASVTQQRSTSVPNTDSEFSLQVNGASSVTTVDIGQRTEAATIKRHGKKMQLFQAKVWNGSGAAFTPNLRVGTPASADDFTTVTNRLDQALQQCADSAWTWVYHLFDPSAYTNIDNGLDIALRVPSGSLVASDTVRIAQFDCRPATHLIPFQPPDSGVQRVLAARYFERQPLSTSTIINIMQAGSNTVVRGALVWSQPKRSSPTVVFGTGVSDFVVSFPGPGTDFTPDTLSSSGGPNLNTAGISSTRAAGFGTLAAGDSCLLRTAGAATYIDLNARL